MSWIFASLAKLLAVALVLGLVVSAAIYGIAHVLAEIFDPTDQDSQ